MRIRLLLLAAVLGGCMLARRDESTAPDTAITTGDGTAAATPAGTLSCREIVETCDSQCQLPDCLHACTARGHAEGQRQHAALVECAQANHCFDEDCVRGNCPDESAACEASGPSEPTPASPTPAATQSP